MIYVGTKQEIETKRKAFIRKWRLKCKAVADSLEDAGDKLFTFTRFPKSQWKSIRTSNAIERLHEGKRGLKAADIVMRLSAERRGSRPMAGVHRCGCWAILRRSSA